MKRVAAAVVILFIAVGSSIGVYFGIISRVNSLLEVAGQARDTVVESGETDWRQTDKLAKEWEFSGMFMAAFLPHSELDEIEIGIRNIQNYQSQKLTDEYLEELNGCINRLEHIKESEKPTFKNIF